MSRVTRDGTAEPVSGHQILRRERGQGNIHFPCSANHQQDWQPYPVDLYICVTVCESIKNIIKSKRDNNLDVRELPKLTTLSVLAGMPHDTACNVALGRVGSGRISRRGVAQRLYPGVSMLLLRGFAGGTCFVREIFVTAGQALRVP